MKDTITGINFNWFYSQQNGEEFTNRTVGTRYGDRVCEKITQYSAVGEGDRWFYDVHYEDGSYDRIFNPNEVFFSAPKS